MNLALITCDVVSETARRRRVTEPEVSNLRDPLVHEVHA
jgi:hypothetical protein